ncbi:MAG: SDR family oxidoreductase [Alphaproteobacteria bacterium]|nr:SDR family oxidoreductase [Alphaproteobacteria bacterium]
MASTTSRRTYIVTGAASGIGAACMQALLTQGHNVCALDRDPVNAPGDGAYDRAAFIALQCDVSNAAACAHAVEAARREFGALHGLIHMAAVHSTTRWEDLSAEEFTRTLEINVTGSFLIAQAAARAMKETGGGAIVLASSGSIQVSGVGGHGRGGPAYVSSKAAIIGLTRALARSLAPHNIRVNAVSPGATRTAMTAEYDDIALAKVGERTLTGKIGEPHEIAAVACFLVSQAASYVDGEIVAVNGGGSMGL